MSKSGDDRFDLRISRKWEIILFVVFFGLAAFLRFWDLSADPPASFSLSTGIETDPPGHTLFARNEVLTGDWNPYHDNRYITYQYSLISGSAWLIYKLSGVGVYQTNLVAVILSLLAIWLFYLVLKKSNGNGVALLALFLIAINYIGIFIGRRPLLENGMNFLFVAALFCLTYGEKKWMGHWLFGLFLAAAIVFGKVIALAFLAVPVVYYFYKVALLKDKRGYAQAVWALTGFAVMAAGWYLLIYAPHASSVSGYMSEQIFGLHGSPEAFDSFSRFLWKFSTFGIKDAFFDRVPAISITALLFVMILISRLFSRDRRRETVPFGNLILISIAVWLVGTYIGEMPWNYQPLRYLSAMIFPLAALTAVAVAYLYNLRGRVNLLNRSIIFNLSAFALVLLLVYQLTRAVVVNLGRQFVFLDYMPFVFAGVFLVSSIYFMLSWKKVGVEIRLPRMFRFSLIGLIILVSFYYQAGNYLAWSKAPTYTMRQASRDLGMILSPGAVLSGPYGPALTAENNFGAVVHYFGTTRPDPTLFERFPVTHLALDSYNEDAARQIYPDMMKRATYVCNYNINCDKITVFRIAPWTGNHQAAGYRPSSYEKAVDLYTAEQSDSANRYLEEFLRQYPNNISGNNQAGIFSLVTGDYRNAVLFFTRAVDFSPTDFKLHFFLGSAYIKLAEKTGEASFRRKGEVENDLARKYTLGKFELDENIFRNPKDRENGTIEEN